MKYQIVFRTSRGGAGIDHEVSKAEFLAVFSQYGVGILKDMPGRHRMLVRMSLSTERITRLGSILGYTQAILHLHEEPYLGEELSVQKKARWYIGWARRGKMKVLFTEVYVQDEYERLRSAPDQRGFLIEKDGQLLEAKGHKFHRGLSPLDAKFMFNIAQLEPGMLLLDPFAGFGGIVLEGRRRCFSIVASDIDSTLRPGLAQVSDRKCAICDANYLPFPSATFDAIVTEPSFQRRHRQATLSALHKLRQVLKPYSRMVLMISEDMFTSVTDNCILTQPFAQGLNPCAAMPITQLGGLLTSRYLLRRNSGLKCYVLRIDFKP